MIILKQIKSGQKPPPALNTLPMLVAMVIAGLLTACGKSDSGSEISPSEEARISNIVASLPPPPAKPQYVTKLRDAFASAGAGMKLNIDETIGLIEGGQFAKASEDLQRLSQKPGLTSEQKEAVNEALAAVRKVGGR